VPKLGGGRADRYAKFLIDELKPFVDREYRTQSEAWRTGIGGSSLGGLVSIYVGLKFSHIFGKIAALSPSVWWNQRVILRFAAAAPVEPRPRIWLDIGTREGPRIVDDVERSLGDHLGWVRHFFFPYFLSQFAGLSYSLCVKKDLIKTCPSVCFPFIIFT